MSLQQGSYTRTQGAAETREWPEFFIDSVQDHVATEREGRPIFKDEERVRIYFPGDQTKRPVFKVTREHADKYPQEYAAFKSGQELALNGTPLEQWPILKRAQVMEMKAVGFRTVEDIAGMSDLAKQRLGMGGNRLCELAKSYLDDAQAGALLTKTTAENERHERTIAEQNEKIANLSALCERLSSEVIAMRNQPHPIATYVPGQHDPAEAARQAFPQEPAAQSSLMDLPAPRKRKAAEATAS
jgi:hypothetical protein